MHAVNTQCHELFKKTLRKQKRCIHAWRYNFLALRFAYFSLIEICLTCWSLTACCIISHIKLNTLVLSSLSFGQNTFYQFWAQRCFCCWVKMQMNGAKMFIRRMMIVFDIIYVWTLRLNYWQWVFKDFSSLCHIWVQLTWTLNKASNHKTKPTVSILKQSTCLYDFEFCSWWWYCKKKCLLEWVEFNTKIG